MSPLYLVCHLPKTAGSTLSATFRRNFTSEEWLLLAPRLPDWQLETVTQILDVEIECYTTPRTRCVFGHWAYWGVHEKVRPEARPFYITFLREPVERCISLYGFIKSRPQNKYHRAIVDNNWSLGEWLENGKLPECSNGQLRRLLFDGTSDIMLEPHLTRDHLEVAKGRLREFWFVGLTETFEQDSLYLYGKLSFRRFHPARVVNATPNKVVASLQEREALLKANALDSELYEFARQLHADWMHEHAREVALRWRQARIARGIYNRVSWLKRAYRGVS